MIIHISDAEHSSQFWLATLPRFVALFTVLFVLGTSPRIGAATDLVVKVGKTVEITSSHRYCWFPTIHRFPTGDIMVAMRMSPDETNPEGDFSAYCLSKDGGLTWTRRYPMGSGANMDAAWSPAPQKDGRIWHLWEWLEAYPPGQSQDFRLTLTKWSRGGLEFQQWRDFSLNFSQPIQMVPTATFDRQISDGHLREQANGGPWGTIIEGLNGDLLALVYFMTAAHPKYYRVGLIRSPDEGKTWKQYSTVAAVEPEDKPWPWMGDEGPNEAALIRLADGQLLTIFRTGSDGHMGETWSADDGKTWTPPVAAPFKGVAPRLRRLSNGMLALTTGRPDPVRVMLNLDGSGKEWTNPTNIFDGKSTHYTDFIEVEHGKLLVVYDSVPYGWYEIPFADRTSKNVIYGTFVEVEKR